MYKGNENKDLIRESSIDVAIVHGGLVIKENRREYGRDANSGLLEFFSLLLKDRYLIRECIWTTWMWEYFLSRETAEIFWQDLSTDERSRIFGVLWSLDLPIRIVLELVVTVMMCGTHTGVKPTRFQVELLVCQLVELLQSAFIYQFIQLKFIMMWGTCLLICLNPADVWCREEVQLYLLLTALNVSIKNRV